MKFDLKALSPEAIPRALAKAERYRLLKEPREAESICLDALEREPDNQEALKTLLLTLTDQFRNEKARAIRGAEPVVYDQVGEAWKIVARLSDEYDRAYYSGIIFERRASANLEDSARAFDWLRKAMSWYEKAEAIRPPANDDALLRWNTCARLIMRELS
jgi:hypothetical protein